MILVHDAVLTYNLKVHNASDGAKALFTSHAKTCLQKLANKVIQSENCRSFLYILIQNKALKISLK